jgi:hypothetical protein
VARVNKALLRQIKNNRMKLYLFSAIVVSLLPLFACKNPAETGTAGKGIAILYISRFYTAMDRKESCCI